MLVLLMLFLFPRGNELPNYVTQGIIDNAGIVIVERDTQVDEDCTELSQNDAVKCKIKAWLKDKSTYDSQWFLSDELIEAASDLIALHVKKHPKFPWKTFCYVGNGESHWRPGATGDHSCGGSYGIFQMHKPSWSKVYDFTRLAGTSIEDAKYQIQVALDHWMKCGPQQWTVYRNLAASGHDVTN